MTTEPTPTGHEGAPMTDERLADDERLLELERTPKWRMVEEREVIAIAKRARAEVAALRAIIANVHELSGVAIEEDNRLRTQLATVQAERDTLRAEVDRWVENYTDLLIAGMEIESAHNDLRERVKNYLATLNPEHAS